MSEEIPEWAVEKAHGLLKVEGGISPRFETYPRTSVPVRALARYIAEHEDPPVDPLIAEADSIAHDHGVCFGHSKQAIHAALRRGIEIGKQS
jgi:hypothetical protein